MFGFVILAVQVSNRRRSNSTVGFKPAERSGSSKGIHKVLRVKCYDFVSTSALQPNYISLLYHLL